MARNYSRRGPYNFTARRRAQLRRAAIISAQKRKKRFATAAKVVGVAGAVGTAAYLGHRHGGKAVSAVRAYAPKINSLAKSRAPVQPGKVAKIGQVRVGGAGPITEVDRARAAVTRAKLAKPRPDRKIYDGDNNVNSQAMTNRSVRQTMRAHRKATQGSRTKSKVATKKLKKGNFTEAQWQAALAMSG